MFSYYRHRPALGECVASFASTFPVAFLEPQLNKYNKFSILFGIEDDRIAAHSLEAKGQLLLWSIWYWRISMDCNGPWYGLYCSSTLSIYVYIVVCSSSLHPSHTHTHAHAHMHARTHRVEMTVKERESWDKSLHSMLTASLP